MHFLLACTCASTKVCGSSIDQSSHFGDHVALANLRQKINKNNQIENRTSLYSAMHIGCAYLLIPYVNIRILPIVFIVNLGVVDRI